ncbi:protein giant-lens [Anabrus simplex]|uniref:protein giant-lens n=1 Tax=Anabrus simplex TaxID=316456 RepID=UPI0034DCDDD3
MWFRFLLLHLAMAVTAAPRTPLVVFHHAHEAEEAQHSHRPSIEEPKVLYQIGSAEDDLPECAPWAVCSKVDLYEAPWVERQCRCPGRQVCPPIVSAGDGHTLTDRTRHLKLCEPIRKLPKCRFFRDVTWTLRSGPDNVTEQVVHCHCPKGAVAYLIKRQAIGVGGVYQYSFACSPQSRLRCQRKEPCRLFTLRKRPELLEEVNTSTLCQCPHGHTCPRHHTEPGVIPGNSYTEEAIRTYSGYCVSSTSYH